MKKLIILTTIVLGMTIGAFAQNGGLFGMGSQRGGEAYDYTSSNESLIGLPSSHGSGTDQNTDTPLGSGALLLMGFGAAYMAAKKRKK